MEGLQNISTYQEFKAATDREVQNQAEGFVRLGYLLRRAEDTDILAESGYKTVTEFAKAEYGLTETYVSRYININRRYSEGGYSDSDRRSSRSNSCGSNQGPDPGDQAGGSKGAGDI